MLQLLSSYSTTVIVVLAILHAGGLLILAGWAARDRRRIAQTLERFTDELTRRSRVDAGASLSDQIDAFLADIADTLAMPVGAEPRRRLAQRIAVLDERRDYLQSMRFETAWNVARTMIESYPLAGVLGTILAIGAALAADENASVAVIVTQFGAAIWSTFAGLTAAIGLMLLHSLMQPSFARLSENRDDVRQVASQAKRELVSPDGIVPEARPIASPPTAAATS